MIGYVNSIYEIDGYVRYDVNSMQNAFSFSLSTSKRKKDLKIGTVIEFESNYYNKITSYELYDLKACGV